jgi:type-IV secretion system protein TraC
MVSAHSSRISTAAHPLIQKIAAERVATLKQGIENGEFYRPELFLFVLVPMREKKRISLFRRPEIFSAAAEAAYGETLEILGQNLDVLGSSLAGAGLSSTDLDRNELIDVIYRFLNPRRSASEPTPTVAARAEPELGQEVIAEASWLASQSPREQLVFGDLLLDFAQYTLDGHYHRVVTLKTLPEVTYAGQLATFLRLPFHYDLALSLEVPPQASEMSKLQQKRRMAHSMAATHGGRASDLESESKLSSTEELIRELLGTGQRIYAAQLAVILRAPATPDGEKTLNRQVREVLARFRALQGAEGLEESVGAWKIVKGNLPAAPVSLDRARKMKTNNLADFLPIYGPREGDEDPAVIFRNRLGGLAAYDAYSPVLGNYSSLVTGSSGAGKSFLYNAVLIQQLARPTRTFIIDVGRSYKKLTEALGGQYLEVDLSDQYRLNPFDIPDPSQEPSNQKIKSLLAVIESMVGEDEKAKLPKLTRALLEKSLIELYKAKRESGGIPTLSDLAKRLASSEEESLRTISKMLYLWTGDRPYGRLLDGQGGLRADAEICTFDLQGLSSYPDLQGVMILILTDFILGRIANEKERKARIIIDEAWELLKSEAAASFMELSVRTLRKMGAGSGITFITQGVEEIVASPIGAAILNNTATKFVMLQRGDTEILRETLKLNPRELALIQSLGQKKGEYSEGFMIEGEHRQVVRIYPTPLEYWLATSDAQDNLYLERLREQGLPLLEAIERAAREYPRGTSRGKTVEAA